jgi:hypothetical protein
MAGAVPMKRQPYIRPMGKPIKPPLWQTILNWVGVAVASLAFGVVAAVLIIEWFAGCGETYIDANGVRHAYECVFIPQPK